MDRAKLNELLQALFGQSYTVVVSAALQGIAQVSFANTSLGLRRYNLGGGVQRAHRSKTIDSGKLLTWKGLLLNEFKQVEKNSVSQNR